MRNMSFALTTPQIMEGTKTVTRRVGWLRLKPGEKCVLEQGQFYLSVPRVEEVGIQLSGDGSLDKDYKYSRSPGHLDFEDTKNVPMTPELIPANSAKLVRERLPAVWKSLGR